MLDFLIRTLRNPLDYLGVVHMHRLHLIRIEQESDQIFSFIFTIPDGLSWRPGQHGVFWFVRDRIKGHNWHAFSIASAPDEKVLRITTIIPDKPSEYKQILKALEPGDTITMQGPLGEFHVHHDMKRAVGIAGGIGITPFRAMLHAIHNGQYPGFHITLIFSAMHNLYTFKNELEQFAESPQIDIIYTETPDEVNAALDAQIQACGNDAAYFISGSPGMISAIKQRLLDKGMTRVINDPFKGY